MDREQKALALAVVGVVLLFGVVYASSVYWEASSGTTFNATDGPEITLGEDTGLYAADPFPDNSTVDFGNVSFSGSNAVSATVTGLNAETTTLKNLETDIDGITINHSSKNDVYLLGGFDPNTEGRYTIDSFSWSNINANSSETEFSIDTAADATIKVSGMQPDAGYRINLDNSPDLTANADKNGVLAFNAKNSSGTITQANSPQLSNPYPIDNEILDKAQVDLQFELAHEDFTLSAGSVSIDWKVNGTVVKTTNTNEEGLQSVQTSEFGPGTNSWSAVVTDSTGDVATINGSFGTPTELELRSEQNPGSLINTSAKANVTFFGDDGSAVTKTTTTGKIDMSGLPLDTPFTVQVEADGYITRQSYVSSVIERQTIYVLEDSTTSVETSFVVEDPTGEFAPDNARVFVQKPITINGTTEYETVVADIAGFGGFSTTLEQDQRYLIEVRNIETGEVRQVGPYVARVSETVALKIDQLDFDFDANKEVPYDWDFSVINNSDGTAVDVNFGAQERIKKLDIVVHERGNESLEIVNKSYRNYDGTVNVRRFIPEDVENPEDKAWVVKWSGTVGGEEVGGSELAGRDLAISPTGMPQHILSIVGIFLIFTIGGLFSAANLTVGAIVVSLVAGALWIVGVIPPGVSGLFIAVGLSVALMYHARRGPKPPR